MLHRRIYLLGMIAVVVALAFFGSGKSFLNHGNSSSAAPAHKAYASAPKNAWAPATGDHQAYSTEEPAWLTEALNDPNPNVRINALEAWARNFRESLDPITHALVDPDESVRSRAQELLEEALARQ